jgi:nitrilase
VKVAVAQPAGSPFDTDRAVDRVATMASEAGADGADLVLFPEAFVGGYPWGLRFGTAVGGRTEAGREMFQRYWSSAVDVPGPEVDRIGEAAREAGAYLCVGVIERDSTYSGGTLFCTLLYFGPDGALLGKHRKLKPTGAERLVWGEGDGSTLTTVDTPFGTLGGLICWENYMPLARMAMYGKGVDIYVAPTADARERWLSTLQHIALEGRCFVLGCNQYVTRNMFPDDLVGAEDELGDRPDPLCRGGSVIYGPQGDLLAGPLWDREGVLMADLELAAIARGKFDFDVTGHYARPDVFTLLVDERPKAPLRPAVQPGEPG